MTTPPSCDVPPRSPTMIRSRLGAFGALLLVAQLLCGFDPFETENEQVERGNAELRQGKPKQALHLYDSAAKELPDAAGVHYNRGVALYKLKKLDKARQALLKATTSGDRELKAKSFYNLGNTLYQMKRYKEAASAFGQALRLRPDHRPSKWNLELALRRLREKKKKKKKNESKKQDKKQQDKKQQDKKQQDKKQQDKKQQDKKQQDKKQQGKKQQDKKQQDKKQQDKKQQGKKQQDKRQQPPRSEQPRRAKRRPEKRKLDQVLDALDRNDKNLQRRRAQMRYRDRRPPAKDW